MESSNAIESPAKRFVFRRNVGNLQINLSSGSCGSFFIATTQLFGALLKQVKKVVSTIVGSAEAGR
jgi:hypothetical protein